MELDNIIQKAQAAIQNFDVSAANKILNAIRAHRLKTSGNIAYPKNLIVQLKIVAFANLLEEEAIDILRQHYLESFALDISMQNQLTSNLFSVPYLVRDEVRKKFNSAVRGNIERIGNLTIGQWIAEFDKEFNIRTRDKSASVQFVMNHPQARLLSATDQKNLKDILYTYDYLLIDTLPDTGEDLTILLNNTDMRSSSINSSSLGSNAYTRPQQTPLHEQIQNENLITTVQMSINEALKSFPEIGEQLITSEKIKLRNFPEPVRPSLKNWLADYTFTLGYDNKDSIKRGNYIFHGNNTMRLSSVDRERLAYVLKAHDEGTPVMVNTNSKQIIFQELNSYRREESAANPIPSTRNQIPNPAYRPLSKTPAANYQAPKPATPVSQPTPQPRPQAAPLRSDYFHQNILNQSAPNNRPDEQPSPQGISFSSPQKLPYEKMKNSPYVIRPVYSQEEKKEEPKPLPKNVVDLKNI